MSKPIRRFVVNPSRGSGRNNRAMCLCAAIAAAVFPLRGVGAEAAGTSVSKVTSNTSTANTTVSGVAPAPTTIVKSAVADNDWRVLQSAITPQVGITAATAGKKTLAQLATERAGQADLLLNTAQQAKNFYNRYPNDANTAQAKKLEVSATLESARLGKVSAEAPALALAAAYRKDKDQPRELRFEVALAADKYQMRKISGDKTAREKPQDHEQLADNLRKEFGTIPEVFGLYTGIAAEADMETANRIATKILEMRPPPFAKLEAQAITARYGLLGRPLALKLTAVDGRKFELPSAARSAAPTVIYVWNRTTGQSPNPFAALAAQSQKAKVGAGVQWIYLGLGANVAEATAARAKAPYPGTHCIDPAGRTSPVAQHLKVQFSPTVFVLNARGVLTGFGHVDELPALLAAANR